MASKATVHAGTDYVKSLAPTVRERYTNKLKVVSNKDPYTLAANDWSTDVDLLPAVTYPDIVNYLVHDTSAYTLESLKAFKSLEAYNYFVSGWVKEMKQLRENGFCIVTAKVLHSQRLSAPPLQPWIIAEANGTVKSAHCTCMAGLGEITKKRHHLVDQPK
ncbi:hypothetical protein WMY93_017934 [Mugilogobius chulae]|uniref:Uncharacterized protein n=1 Tax=Mugilogobius chulae TaxID=88201 RepID=A0AAW0NMD7_9GOBI